MEYDSKKTKRIKNNEKYCPFCNSLDIKEYLYGEPSYDYDKNKYVLGGCELTLDSPKYKCSNCGKDIYLEENNYILDSINSNINIHDNDIDKNSDYIYIEYENNSTICKIYLAKNRVTRFNGIIDIIASISLYKNDFNSIYKIDDVQKLDPEDFNIYYNKIIKITNNWINEFDNNKLVYDKEVKEWSLIINNKENNIKFSDKKVPTNMNEFKEIILELEDLYKLQFEKRRKKINNLFENS